LVAHTTRKTIKVILIILVIIIRIIKTIKIINMTILMPTNSKLTCLKLGGVFNSE